MLVKTQTRGREITGLDVGVNNVRRYFHKDAAVIEIELDHLQIQCGLEPGFWQDEPAIHDRRLSAWLEAKSFHQRPNCGPIPLAMIPAGKNTFRLRTIPPGHREHNRRAVGSLNTV